MAKLQHRESDTEVTRYTLAFPELPSELSKLVEADTSTEIPDYSNLSLDELDDDEDYGESAQSVQSVQFVQSRPHQGGYDAQLDWRANDSQRLLNDSLFTSNALLRRALIGGAKGCALGCAVGGLLSVFASRHMTLTHTLPASFHVYTVGGCGFMFGGMNMVHQGKRYKEYLGFKQSGIGNPEMVGLRDAKNQMADWMASAYSPEYVEQWKESEEAERALQDQLAGIRG